MNYCCTNHQREGSCYFEFQRGRFTHQYWLDRSLYLSLDVFDQFEIGKLFLKAIPDFDSFGITKITCEGWQTLMTAAENTTAKPVFDELNPWVQECFLTNNQFTVIGI